MRGLALLNKNLKKAFIALLLVAIPLLSYTAYSIAAETRTDKTANSPGISFSESEYSIEGSTITLDGAVTTSDIAACNVGPNVTCRNLTGSNPELVYECSGLSTSVGTGGWTEKVRNGQCWTNLDVVYFEGTINETIVVPKPSGALTAPNMSIINQSSDCLTTVKGICIHNYDGSETLETNTGDDMFALPLGGGSFVEYPVLGLTDPFSLKHVSRFSSSSDKYPGKKLMVPSGPPSDYSDYKSFLRNPPSFVSVRDGCYPANFSICKGDAVTPPAIDGACPVPDISNVHMASQPAELTNAYNEVNLCSRGTFEDVADTSVDFKWRCKGIHGGSDAQCSSKTPVPGICGSSNNQFFSAQPSNNLCSRGAVVSVSGNGPWTWQCDSLPSGALPPVDCRANLSIQGQCGGADNSSVARAPSGNSLCSTGDPTTVSGNGPWTWKCQGTDLTSSADDATCTARLNVCDPGPTGNPENGTCGSAHGDEFLTASAVAAAQRCLTGNPTAVVAATNSFSWSCTGTGAGATNQNCAAGKAPTPTCQPPATGSDENGTCGAAHGGTFASASAVNSAGRCITGSATNVSDSGSSFSWRCNGQGSGANDSCTATKSVSYNAECKAYASSYNSQPATNNNSGCVSGTYQDVTDTSSEFKWKCVDGTATAQCSATVQVATGSWRLDFTSVEDFGSCRDRLSGNRWCPGNQAPTGSCSPGSSCIHQSACREPAQNSMTAYKTWDHYVCE